MIIQLQEALDQTFDYVIAGKSTHILSRMSQFLN